MFGSMNGELNNMFNGIFKELEKNVKQEGVLLTADIKETANSFVVLADIPGVKKEDISITFDDGILKIETPERDIDVLGEGEKFLLAQRTNVKKVGHFKFKQSVDQDSVKAVYRDGVLSVEIQKKEKDISKTIIVE